MTAWDDAFINQDLANNARLDTDILSRVSDDQKRGCTVIRILLHLWYTPVAGVSVDGTQRMIMGIQLASEDAFAAQAVPDPNNAAEFPIGGWMMRDLVVVAAGGAVQFQNPPVEQRLDLRSQRKVDRAELIFSIENNAGSGTTFGVSVQGIIRTLYKLP